MLEDWEDSVNIGKLLALASINWFDADKTHQLRIPLGAGILVRAVEKSCDGVSFGCLGKKNCGQIDAFVTSLAPEKLIQLYSRLISNLYLILTLQDTMQRA